MSSWGVCGSKVPTPGLFLVIREGAFSFSCWSFGILSSGVEL